MKTAQELRAGNVFMLDGQPMVVQKSEYNKSGRKVAVGAFFTIQHNHIKFIIGLVNGFSR